MGQEVESLHRLGEKPVESVEESFRPGSRTKSDKELSQAVD